MISMVQVHVDVVYICTSLYLGLAYIFSHFSFPVVCGSVSVLISHIIKLENLCVTLTKKHTSRYIN